MIRCGFADDVIGRGKQQDRAVIINYAIRTYDGVDMRIIERSDLRRFFSLYYRSYFLSGNLDFGKAHFQAITLALQMTMSYMASVESGAVKRDLRKRQKPTKRKPVSLMEIDTLERLLRESGYTKD